MPTDPHQNEPTHPAEGEHHHRQHRRKHHDAPHHEEPQAAHGTVGEPSPAVQPAPSPTITIAEPAAPTDRPYTPPTLISDEELAALAAKRMAEQDRAARQETPQVLTDGQVEIRAEGDRIIARRVGDPVPANAPLPAAAPLSQRALSRRELEMEAGRRAIARAMEQQSHRPPMVKTANEISSEGTNTPVFRPGDFREYANMRAGNASKDSGSSILERVQRTVPET